MLHRTPSRVPRPAISAPIPAEEIPRCSTCKKVGVRAGVVRHDSVSISYCACRWCYPTHEAAERAAISDYREKVRLRTAQRRR